MTNFRVQINDRQGSYSWKYFDNIDDAIEYKHPARYDFMGKEKKLYTTVQEKTDKGKWVKVPVLTIKL